MLCGVLMGRKFLSDFLTTVGLLVVGGLIFGHGLLGAGYFLPVKGGAVTLLVLSGIFIIAAGGVMLYLLSRDPGLGRIGLRIGAPMSALLPHRARMRLTTSALRSCPNGISARLITLGLIMISRLQ